MTFAAPDLPVKLEAIRTALEWATESPIFWYLQADEGRIREPNEVWGEIQIGTISKIGIDDIRYTDTGATPYPVSIMQTGIRHISFDLRMKSRSQEHVTSAWYAAVRGQQRISSFIARNNYLSPNDLALIAAGDIIDTIGGVDWDDRLEDVAVFELNFATSLTDTDAANVTTWIEHIEASTGFKNAGGVDLPASLQLDKEVMP